MHRRETVCLSPQTDALRQKLGFEKWAVLGHSFGGHVALEYALRYPDSLSHPLLLDTGGDSRWARQNAGDLLAKREYVRTVILGQAHGTEGAKSRSYGGQERFGESLLVARVFVGSHADRSPHPQFLLARSHVLQVRPLRGDKR
jgi:pimeloyl-ACP methyl ester carboxylesterase